MIPVLGKFKEKDIHCKECGKSFKSHEEKRTDINVALKIVSEAVLNNYDTGILVSGDTDMIPAIETVRYLSLNKRIGVLFPLKRFTNELKEIADFNLKIKKMFFWTACLKATLLQQVGFLQKSINSFS